MIKQDWSSFTQDEETKILMKEVDEIISSIYKPGESHFLDMVHEMPDVSFDDIEEEESMFNITDEKIQKFQEIQEKIAIIKTNILKEDDEEFQEDIGDFLREIEEVEQECEYFDDDELDDIYNDRRKASKIGKGKKM